jgi:hypothetical protein
MDIVFDGDFNLTPHQIVATKSASFAGLLWNWFG